MRWLASCMASRTEREALGPHAQAVSVNGHPNGEDDALGSGLGPTGSVRLRPLTRASSLRRTFGHYRRYSGYLPLAVEPRRASAYVGWVGERNVGDDAMHQAHRTELPHLDLRPVPNVGTAQLPRVLQRSGLYQPRSLCLGGGTLIGNGFFGNTLENWLQAAPDAPRFMLGVGVEDPRFGGRRGTATAKELKRWVALLQEFPVVRVRGPLSRQVLADVGISSTVSGDPALLLGDPCPSPARSTGLLGLNVGVCDDLWGGNLSDVLCRLREFARDQVRRGWRVRLFPFSNKDRAVCRQVADYVGAGTTVYGGFRDVPRLLEALRECQVFVGLKLHSVVLATTVFVPSVAIEYLPKCRDFQASIGREDWTIRSDQVDLDRLRELTQLTTTDQERQRYELDRAVRARRQELLAASAGIRSSEVPGAT